MNTDQIAILAILAATVAMFLRGRWRHDMVAVAALLACVLAGLTPVADAFLGFGHPAVITVACVLVLSRGLQTSGAVDALARTVLPAKAGPTFGIAVLVTLGALLSSFMNNVGAMALLMPVAIQISRKHDLTPGRVLMPLAFGTILGGMTTMIGTPPNLIVSGFRAQTGVEGFGMFDFTPVGVAVATGGVVFVAIFNRWLVPSRKQTGIEGFESDAYLTEARVTSDSKTVGQTLRSLESKLEESGAQIVALVRNELRMTAPGPFLTVQIDDILVIEAEAKSLASALSGLGLKLEEAKSPDDEEDKAETDDSVEPRDTEESEEDDEAEDKEEAAANSGEIVLMELAVLPASSIVGRSASDILLRTRYGLNLLALSRQGQRSTARLRSLTFRSGDLLLMQGPPEAISEFASDNGCVPLAERELRIPNKRKAVEAGAIMACAIAGAAFGILPAAISFAFGVLASMVLRTVPPRAVYSAIDWPVIVLLGALMPVAGAMEATGAADLIARFMFNNLAQGSPVVALSLILVVTMFLSDLMNNAATAAVMCPIALGAAAALDVNADSFLMAVAIGASCAFLTPVGHQNNTLILGPGGFRFGDYWKLGLPLEAIVFAITIPLLLVVWPL